MRQLLRLLSLLVQFLLFSASASLLGSSSSSSPSLASPSSLSPASLSSVCAASVSALVLCLPSLASPVQSLFASSGVSSLSPGLVVSWVCEVRGTLPASVRGANSTLAPRASPRETTMSLGFGRRLLRRVRERRGASLPRTESKPATVAFWRSEPVSPSSTACLLSRFSPLLSQGDALPPLQSGEARKQVLGCCQTRKLLRNVFLTTQENPSASSPLSSDSTPRRYSPHRSLCHSSSRSSISPSPRSSPRLSCSVCSPEAAPSWSSQSVRVFSKESEARRCRSCASPESRRKLVSSLSVSRHGRLPGIARTSVRAKQRSGERSLQATDEWANSRQPSLRLSSSFSPSFPLPSSLPSLGRPSSISLSLSSPCALFSSGSSLSFLSALSLSPRAWGPLVASRSAGSPTAAASAASLASAVSLPCRDPKPQARAKERQTQTGARLAAQATCEENGRLVSSPSAFPFDSFLSPECCSALLVSPLRPSSSSTSLVSSSSFSPPSSSSTPSSSTSSSSSSSSSFVRLEGPAETKKNVSSRTERAKSVEEEANSKGERKRRLRATSHANRVEEKKQAFLAAKEDAHAAFGETSEERETVSALEDELDRGSVVSPRVAFSSSGRMADGDRTRGAGVVLHSGVTTPETRKEKEAVQSSGVGEEKEKSRQAKTKKIRPSTARQREEGEKKKTLAVIDGTCVVFRSHFGMPEVLDGGGFPVQAIIGFFRSLAAIRRALLHPSHLVVVFDGPESRESRKAIFDGYKGHRSETPASLINQFAVILRLCERMQIGTLSEAGVEADDVIATLVNRACRVSREAAEKKALAAQRGVGTEKEKVECKRSEKSSGKRNKARDGQRGDQAEEGESRLSALCMQSKSKDLSSERASRGVRQKDDRSFWGSPTDADIVFDEIVVATADKDLLQVLQHNYMEPTAVSSPVLSTSGENANCMRRGEDEKGGRVHAGEERVERQETAAETSCLKHPKIRIMQLHRKMQLIDDAWVKMEYGVAAHQIRDYLALTGDSVDGIEGCPSIGPVTAQKIVSAAGGNVNELLQDGAALRRLLKPSQVKHLSTFLPLFERNQHLISLNYEVESLSDICLSRFEVKKKTASAPLCSRRAAPSLRAAKFPLTHAFRQHTKTIHEQSESGKSQRPAGSFSSTGLPFFRRKPRDPAPT
ncbi:5'-3' exonuclease, N-terminal resolvase family domain-containing protein [Toxoplasma gondii VEG]|uniref:5'-3' exonuclease, N-terminal resolvase family domain-containing protein n=1 Tax=Toxoplasma gondii (strain ATCC 50861 / VEG) TaxID=432359 RepID=V4ZDT3_TOXGV|nr:5'-3' exonuclease, N-terminal resolvase family domain-containing protein [Toxoplasma gondii VEG]